MAASPTYGLLPLVERAATPRRPDRIVFICGLHRSGTTALEAWLHSRFDLTVLRAPVPENEGQHLQDILPGDHLHGGPGHFALDPAMRPPAPRFWQIPTLRREILRGWTPHMQGESPILLEKSPPNITRIAWLRAVFPGSCFVLLTRHPQAVAMASRKWLRKTKLQDFHRHWQTAHRIALADWQSDCLHLRYEDLCADPETALQACAQTFQLPQRPSPRPLPERFATLTDTNADYLAASPRPLRRGLWNRFGYADTTPA
ncbi:sulfotransferase family protein [Neogemmobacter tilapiae]|nr:sulfotransferase [Gemmobacter tilapiae]